jgi:hypothetical protein
MLFLFIYIYYYSTLLNRSINIGQGNTANYVLIDELKKHMVSLPKKKIYVYSFLHSLGSIGLY